MKSQLVDSNGRAADAEVQLVSPTGAPLTEPKAPEQLQLVPFNDGYVYKFSDNPARKGTYVMHTVDGNIVAVLPDARVANLLCEAMRMLNLANQSIGGTEANGTVPLGEPTGPQGVDGVTEGDVVPEFAKEKVVSQQQPVVFES